MKIKYLLLLLLFIAINSELKAQTVTDPWATLGASTIQTAFVVLDANNNLYVSNFLNSTISKITPNGTVTQAWATLATNTRPYGMVIDPSGILYTVNRGSPSPYTISKITPTSDGSSGTVIQTWANLGTEAYTISMDASGNLYTPFVGTNQIAKIVPAVGGATGTVTKPWVTLGSGANPFSISFDTAGNLYSANSNNTISKITPAGSVTQVWATLAAGSNPQFSVFDATGNLYVSCWGTSSVTKINSSGTVTDVWSLGTSVWPAGIVLDTNGNIFTANYNNHTVSKISSSGTVTQAFASLANGSNPFYLAKDTNGNLYTTNMGNGTVSRISGPPSVKITSSATGAVCAGTSVTFTAVASNILSPTYQWYKNGGAISGATSSSYSSTTLSNNDQIHVKATPSNVSASTVTSNLIANLDAGNSSSYNGSGNTWTDLTGNGNNVALTNTGYSSVNGGGILLNTNGYGTQTLSSSPFNGDFTWSAIFKYDDNNWDWIYNVGGYNGMVLTTLGKPALSWGGWFNNKIDGSAESLLTNGNYYMLTFVRSGNAIFCYLQASPYGVGSSVSGNISLVSPTIGKGPGGEAWQNGIVNLILLYNRALTQSEITENYNTYAARFGFSAAPISSNTITTTLNPTPTSTITVTGDSCINKTTLNTTLGLTSYAWYKDNLAVSGATSNTYIPSSAGDYKVVVSNGTCNSTSSSTTITNCGLTKDGSMSVLETSTILVSKDGAINNGKGIDERGKVLSKPWVYGTVTTATGRIWLDRNLGASRVAISSTDTQAYGDYYQWGRPADGHQTKYLTNNNSTGFTNTKSTTSVPATDLWIEPTDGSNDWLSTPDNTLWAGSNPPNNPCPAGFRIPTETEWNLEKATWSSQNAAGAFASPLKLTQPGMLTSFSSSGAYFTAKNNHGQYLTQSASSDGRARYFGLNGSGLWWDNNYWKSHGMSCRCIKD